MAKKTNTVVNDGIIQNMVETSKFLNKKFKNTELNISYGVEDETVADVRYWIPTGVQPLDVAISNLPVGGYPSGRMTILYGPEQTGKSLLAMHALAETQRLGGVAIYIDTERAFPKKFAKAIGIDLSTLIHIGNNQLELIFAGMSHVITKHRMDNPDQKITIVIDSVAGCITESELAVGFENTGYNTGVSKLLSSGFKKIISLISDLDICLIVTNQVRQNMNAGPFQSRWRMVGGQALPHYASVIVGLYKDKKYSKNLHGIERVLGRGVRAKIEKNRMGPPEVQTKFDIWFNRGVDNYASWAPYIKAFKICKFSGAWVSYEYTTPEGEIVSFKENGWPKFCSNVLEANEVIAEQIWDKICDKLIMVYKDSDSVDFDDIDVEDVKEDDV